MIQSAKCGGNVTVYLKMKTSAKTRAARKRRRVSKSAKRKPCLPNPSRTLCGRDSTRRT